MIIERPKIHWLCEYAVEIRFETDFSLELTSLLSRARDWLLQQPPIGVEEVVLTYQCITVFYSPIEVFEKLEKEVVSPFEYVSGYLRKIPWQSLQEQVVSNCREYVVPVAYGSEDLDILNQQLNLPVTDIIALHQSTNYIVHMIGFLPGFPYMGTLPKLLQVNRKEKPSLLVRAGSVAIAGKQTGIYSQDSPGGWYILGKSDLKLFDPTKKTKSLFKTGDFVRFKAI